MRLWMLGFGSQAAMDRQRNRWGRWLPLSVALLLSVARAGGQTVQFQELPFDQLSNHDIGPNGEIALTIRPTAWHQGESPHFILHYRRITEAKRVALEIEFYLGYVAKTLSAGPERYAHKSHVFIFEDEADWAAFLGKTSVPPWSASFAFGDELFLNVRVGRTGMFNSQTLAHELTHAAVARLYPGKNWPLWLSEGFAEQMSGQGVGARMGQYNPRLLQRFQVANLPLPELTSMTVYPADPKEVARLYQTGERLVRFLMTGSITSRFTKFIDDILAGDTLEGAIPKIYGDVFPTYAAFGKKFDQFK